MATRLAQHINRLKKKQHHSNYLQNAWNKYPESEFRAILLEVVSSRAKLVDREQYWIDHHNSYKDGFNGRPSANNMFGMEWSESTNEKRREANKKTWSDPKLREKLSNKFKGVHRGVWTDESRKLVSQKIKAFLDQNPSHVEKMHTALAVPAAQKRRMEGIERSLQDPKIRSARIKQLRTASKSPKKIEMLRLAYFQKFGRSSAGCDTPEEFDELCLRLYKEGMTVRAIGRELDIDHKSVSSRLKRMGVEIKRHPISGSEVGGSKLKEADVRQILERIKEGESVAKIAKKFSVSPGTIYDIKSGKTWRGISR
jgi:DNA invertase Pin-like site-specific DNA recombinase